MSTLSRIFTAVNKRYKALDEDINLSDYIQAHALDVKVNSEPFNHVVIDNFFKEDFLEELTHYYQTIFSKGLVDDDTEKERFHLFEKKINYDGYVFSPEVTQEEPLKLFFSVAWNRFFSNIFNKPTTFGTSFALHHHPTGDKAGWVHHDYATYTFPYKLVLPNGVTGTRGEAGKVTLTPAEEKTKNIQQKRTIALIFYFNNPEWKEGDGGETGLYTSKSEDSLFKKVAPVNNRLLAFDVSPQSFHAFQENHADRNSFVQWFHVDLEWAEHKYGFL